MRINGVVEALDKNGKVLASIPTPKVEGKFPPVEQVIPCKASAEEKRAALFGMNPAYLGEAAQAFKLCGLSKYGSASGIRFTPGEDDCSPMRMDAETEDGCQVIVIIMPMRLE